MTIKGLRYGVGINDADYPGYKFVNGVRISCPFISRWDAVLKRCYSNTAKIKNPTYIDCYVDPSWLLFSNFKSWMETQNWGGLELDKDIIKPGNKIYCANSCVFVPKYVNNLFNTHNLRDKSLPLGVSVATRSSDMLNDLKNPYCVRVRILGKIKPLGCYSTPEAAHKAWQLGKIEAINTIMDKYSLCDYFDERVYNGMNLRILKLKEDNQKGVITKWL